VKRMVWDEEHREWVEEKEYLRRKIQRVGYRLTVIEARLSRIENILKKIVSKLNIR